VFCVAPVEADAPPASDKAPAVIHEFPSAEAAEAWAEELRQHRHQLHTLGDLCIVSVPAI
jgi:hypothetical protein